METKNKECQRPGEMSPGGRGGRLVSTLGARQPSALLIKHPGPPVKPAAEEEKVVVG